jgi:hypothetical protein
LCFLYLAVAVASLFYFLADPAIVEVSTARARIIGALFLLIGFGLFATVASPPSTLALDL